MSEAPIRKILVVCCQRLGDVLLTTPLIRACKEKYPDALVDVLVLDGTQGILEGNPDINGVLAWRKKVGWIDGVRRLVALYRQYDWAIAVIANDRSRFYAWVGGRHRIGFFLDGWGERLKRLLFQHPIHFSAPTLHTLHNINRLGAPLGVRPHTNIIPPQINRARQQKLVGTYPALFANKINGGQANKIAVLHPYPKFAYKMWRREHWVRLMALLAQKGYTVALSGSSAVDERDYILALMAESGGRAINLAGQMSLADMAEVVKHCDLYIGVDTVMTHLAAGLGVPTVALFGPTNPLWWGPQPKDGAGDLSTAGSPSWTWRLRAAEQDGGVQTHKNVVLVQSADSALSCVPCHQEGCDRHINSGSACLQTMSVAQVLSAISRLNARSAGEPIDLATMPVCRVDRKAENT